MFKTAPVVQPAHDVEVPAGIISLVELELSLPAPTTGWLIELDQRHIEVLTDDIGRPSISRSAARELLAENRANEVRKTEMRAESEKRAVEADQRFRRQLFRGMPATAFPDGTLPATATLMAAHDSGSQRKSVHETLLEQELSRASGLVYQSIGGGEDDAA